MAHYTDSLGNVWDSADDALQEFVDNLPCLDDDETETVFQFTSRDATAADNLRAIAYGVTYAGLDDRFEGDNYPVPYPAPEYVNVVFVQNWDEFEGDAPEWGDWQAMAEYLTQWDYGTETDDAHTMVDDNGRRGSGTDDAIVATVNDGDIEYRLTVHYGLRYAALTREPLTR